jgi:hypothetical protein
MADKIATLHLPGKDPVELPILSGTVGPDVIDVRKLGAQGYFTFDPGFMATGSCKSAITYIDGDQGVLLHRGYPIALKHVGVSISIVKQWVELCGDDNGWRNSSKCFRRRWNRIWIFRIMHALEILLPKPFHSTRGKTKPGAINFGGLAFHRGFDAGIYQRLEG